MAIPPVGSSVTVASGALTPLGLLQQIGVPNLTAESAAIDALRNVLSPFTAIRR
jgi:hypothetical protein